MKKRVAGHDSQWRWHGVAVETVGGSFAEEPLARLVGLFLLALAGKERVEWGVDVRARMTV